MPGPSRRSRIAGGIGRRLTRAYFAVAYSLLLDSTTGRRLLELVATNAGVAVHGYLTADDLDALLGALRPAIGRRLLDLGCGTGGVALEVQRRSGVEIVGIDTSTRALVHATAGVERAGVGRAVRFVAGDLAHPPLVGAAGAYAIDSLMFAPSLSATIRGIGEAIDAEGRLFATMLVVGAPAHERMAAVLSAASVGVEVLDDVTEALAATSRRSAGVARALLRASTTTRRGRLAMLMVLGEESLVGWAIGRNRLSRWRFVVRYAAREP
jgi:SAM-dependent methyltransferase